MLNTRAMRPYLGRIVLVALIVALVTIRFPSFTQTFATALSAVGTLVLAALTYRYVRATLQLVRASNRTLTEMQETRRAQARPYIFAYFTIAEKWIYLHIKNTGVTGARDVRLEYPDTLPRIFVRADRIPVFLQRGIPFLPPGQRLTTTVNFYPHVNVDFPLTWDCTVSYSSQAGGERYREQVILDLEQFVDRVAAPQPGSHEELGMDDLVGELQRVNRTLRELTW